MGRGARSMLCRALIVMGLLLTVLCFSPILLASRDSSGSPYGKPVPPAMAGDQGASDDDSCAPPGAPGVNVCQPSTPKSCNVQGWATVAAAGTGASGTVARMELWVNRVKLAKFDGDHIDASMYLQDEAELTIVEVDSKGGYIRSPVYTIQYC